MRPVPPSLTLPRKGGGNSWKAQKITPSPLMGEGRGGGVLSVGRDLRLTRAVTFSSGGTRV